MIDVIFVCDKWEDFMLDTIPQPLKYPGNRVVLISTPEILARFDDGIKKYDISLYDDDDLKETYVHRSPNYYAMERHCIRRWAIIESWRWEHACYHSFSCDTDVLIFNNMDDINLNFIPDYEYTMSTPNGHCPTLGACYWNNEKAINCYTSYIFQYYSWLKEGGRRTGWIDEIEKTWQAIKGNPSGGGISDMSFAGIMRDHSPYEYFDTSKVFGGQTLDHNLMAQYDNYEFDIERRIKKLYKIDGNPHFKKTTGELVRASTLHCSQHAKHLIHDFAEGRF
jgi:hypothetical protein